MGRVLVVDDDPDLCELMQDALSDEYDIQTCSEGSEVRSRCEQWKPAIVILDVFLNKNNALHICQDVVENVEHPPMFLVISGQNTLEQRLDSYNYGGDDFLAKPFQISELKAKVATLCQFYKQRADLHTTNEYATKTAMNAMAEAAQYGGVLRFFNDMYKADNVEKIKTSFFRLMNEFGLKSSIQFRMHDTQTFDYTGAECSPIEMQIYDNLNIEGRIIPFSNRVLVNGLFVSFIVKNMPIDDDVTHGRLKDILATLVEGLNSKISDLQRLNLLRQTASEVAACSQRLSDVMNHHEGFIMTAMSHVISEINSSFNVLDLNEEQEKFFTNLAENIINSVESSFVHIGNEQDVLNCLWRSLVTVLDQQSDDDDDDREPPQAAGSVELL